MDVSKSVFFVLFCVLASDVNGRGQNDMKSHLCLLPDYHYSKEIGMRTVDSHSCVDAGSKWNSLAILLFALGSRSVDAGRIGVRFSTRQPSPASLEYLFFENFLAEATNRGFKRSDFHPIMSDIPSIPGVGTLSLPIGQLAPFRSPSFQSYTGPRLEQFDKIIMLARIASKSNDEVEVRGIVDTLEEERTSMSAGLSRVRGSNDFQTRELYLIMESLFLKEGRGSPQFHINLLNTLVKQLRTRAESLSSSTVLNEIEEKDESATRSSDTNGPGISLLFTGKEGIWKSESVPREFQELMRDHKNLINSGTQYGQWGPSDQIGFLEKLEAIENRWESFYGRLALTGDLERNPGFQEQAQSVLASAAGVTPVEYRKVVADVHARMRKDAMEGFASR